MKIGIPRETDPFETRTPIVPKDIKVLVELGAEVSFEKSLGLAAGYSDKAYMDLGAKKISRAELFSNSTLLLCIGPPKIVEVSLMQSGTVYVGFLNPFDNVDLLKVLAAQEVSALSMEMIPRITRAQNLDALSSQASLAGYVSVIQAAFHLNRIFPMMTTPAGTIPPARVFVIGVGVAGLQAIATAKRLGARVEAFDTRPEVEEQVRSLGAKFLKVDLGKTESTDQGYAKSLNIEQMRLQQIFIEKVCHYSDVVITSAQIFGRKAPIIIKKHVLTGMRSGSVMVDLAVGTGGNIEGVGAGELIEEHGVKIVGLENLPGLVPADSSKVYSSNIVNLVSVFWDEKANNFFLNREDEIIKACLVTHGGQVCLEQFKSKF